MRQEPTLEGIGLGGTLGAGDQDRRGAAIHVDRLMLTFTLQLENESRHTGSGNSSCRDTYNIELFRPIMNMEPSPAVFSRDRIIVSKASASG